MKGFERHLRAAVLLLETRNFGRAARAFGISQPAFSVLISDLEARLGAPLFHRTTRMVEPLDYARPYLTEVRRAIEALDASSRSIEEISALRRGRVVVTSLSSLSARLMPTVMRRVWDAHPGIDLILQDDVAVSCLSALMAGEADFAVTGALPLPAGLHRQDLLQDPLNVLMPANHPLATKSTVSLAQLSGETLVLLSTTSGVHDMVNEALEQTRVKLKRRIFVSHLVTIHGMVAAGLGVALLPRLALPEAGGKVEIRPLAGTWLARTVSISWRRDRALSPAATAVLEIFQELARSESWGAGS